MEQLKALWPEILQSLKEDFNVQDITFDTFLKPLQIHSVEGTDLYILYPDDSNSVALNFINNRYSQPIMVKIAEFTNVQYTIHMILPKDVKGNPDTNLDIPSNAPDYTKSNNYIHSNLKPKFTFDTFVVGENNRFAQNASLAVAETSGEAYNPLYIHGGPGLGKTHLMHAIGNYIIKENSDKQVLYVTSEEYTNEVIEAIRNSSSNASVMTKLREKYRNVDVLMIDDIQFIINKPSTQDEFFHTFNYLHDAGKQIVITSDRPPKELETLDMRFRTRFEMGLMVEITYPNYETRVAILRKKSEERNVHFDDEILNYIASNIHSNVREIEGALNKLIAYSTLEKTEITIEIAERELQNIISPEKPREITPQLIIEVVAEHYNISVDQMISKNRSANISRPRQIAMFLCRQMVDTPLDAIGTLLGGRDHTTIIHGTKKIQNEYDENPEVKKEIDSIKKKINPN
ncbi:MAG: chromosomal replication initiator protein DnaA [Lachnospiraceae bacterium]|nr:chromosomal replication initiator protein DnaA [Lachnospiraceae bacterium]